MLADLSPLEGNRRTDGGLNVAETDEWISLRGSASRTYPNTPRQTTLNNRCQRLAAYWTETLNPGQQTAWANYAAATAYPHDTKTLVFLTGPAMFRAANLPRLAGGLTIRATAPPGMGLATFTDPAIRFLNSNKVEVTIDPTDTWAVHTGGIMTIAISYPVSPHAERHATRFQLLAYILGDTVDPPDASRSWDNPYDNPNTHAQWFGWHVTDHTGRPGPQE